MPELERPDPDQLLARVRRQEVRDARGKLRLYFGACAGVGKTYAMLLATRRYQAEGVDVVIGFVETHGRAETQALLHGPGATLEVLPPRVVEHRGHLLSEFDLDAALLRRPKVIVVDELAHTNVVGSRHPKRWQDIEELLASGIDVLTALNVQHLESLSDVVAGITGIRVLETVPDKIFDQADEVIVVDIPPEEVLKRLAAGQVYLPEQAERAAKNFFRRGNLLALREIALRRTADRVEADVQSYRVEQSISPVWRTEGSLLCCVGPNPGAEHIVRSAARLAHRLDVPWSAVYVETPQLQRLPSIKREHILRTLRLAQDLGAETAVLSGSDAASVLLAYARTGNFSKLVVGRPRRRSFRERSVARAVALEGADLDLIEIGRPAGGLDPPEPAVSPGLQPPLVPSRQAPKKARWAGYGATALLCIATALLCSPLTAHFSLTNIAMIFLLAVALSALRWGRGPAILAAFMCVAEYDFFFVPPRFSFAVADWQYLVTFAVMLIVALIIGKLAADLRYEARVAAHREGRARALYEFSRRLSSVLVLEDVLAQSTDAIAATFGCEAAILPADRSAELVVPQSLNGRPDFEPALAQWAMRNGQPAGANTDTLPGSAWLYLPLKSSLRTRGVLAIAPKSKRFLMIPEQLRQLETFASLVAIALERVHYVEVAQHALVSIESERLRNSLLAALSHDLRTPLTALMGLAESMFYLEPPMNAQYRETVQAMLDEAQRMSALMENLLEMARIQSGDVRLNRSWTPLEEVVGSALKSVGSLLQKTGITVHVGEPLPMAELDPVLMERVLVNLLENVAKYTPRGSTVSIAASVIDTLLRIRVEDDGPGLPESFAGADRVEQIFEKFTRGERESARGGVGLGLAICKAIVEAHRGTIKVDMSATRGAAFVITLPRGDAPHGLATANVERNPVGKTTGVLHAS